MTAANFKLPSILKVSILTIVSSMFLSSCEVKDIELVEVEDVKIEKVEGGKIDGVITVMLRNPNGFPVTIKSGDFTIWAGKTEMGTAQLNESFKINSNSTESYPIKLKGDVGGVLTGGLAGLIGMFTGEDPKLVLKGEIKARSFLITRTVPVELATDLNLSSFLK
ncbi:MAG TPA: hypothetical protein DCX14_14735 [Flavobacteriales bacterium]|jgi:LEA14-like dessication related protein|nr:LEA type 2 family protein [Flavobacteriales bacterium]HAW21436.1 hypothetical protein [Flavobacteriales bacterium]